MKKFYLGFLCTALLTSAELYAGKTHKQDGNTSKKIEYISSETPILEEKDEGALQRKLSTSTTHSDTHSEMDVEKSETPSPQDVKKMQDMAFIFEAALKNIGNDFNQHDLAHIHHTFNAMTPRQQHDFLEHFSFEKVEHHLLNNLKTIYHHLNAK